MPVLQNISRDYKMPILYFSFDSQTSETGIKTRLEAFIDMITMRKEKGV
jgi:benzoyl-CoA reductase/2-hydroxyglutaryl-CoA dehydratase subunit BcrC/BadD/HgdB